VGWSTPAQASCQSPSNPIVARADALIDSNPEQAEATATAELSKADADHSLAVRAGLYLVIAKVRSGEGRARDASESLTTVRELLKQLPADQRTLELRMGVVGAAAAIATRREEFERVREEADQLFAETTAGSLPQICLRLTRGDVNAELDRPDLAVADAIAAYQEAQAHQYPDASMYAALRLATIYRRGGLLQDAELMANEAGEQARARGYRRLLWLVDFTTGQIDLDGGRWDAALAVLPQAREVAISLGDRLDAAFTTLPMCGALIGANRLDEADSICRSGVKTFEDLGRLDLATDALMYQSRIALQRSQYKAALEGFNTILNERLELEPLRYLGPLYRDRARALRGLGRYREAAEDLEHSISSTERAAVAERGRSMAILNGIAETRMLETANRDLASENSAQRQQLDSQRVVRRLIISLAVTGFLGCCLLAYLLYLGQRHRRALARYAATLDTLTKNLPDTVMLLDPGGRMLFANRCFPGAASITVGTSAEIGVPEPARAQFRSFIEDVIRETRSGDLQASWPAGREEPSHFEIRATPVLSAGELIGITVRCTDVTVRQLLENRLTLQARVLETMNEGVIIIEGGDRVSFANDAMWGLLGYSPDGESRLSLELLNGVATELQSTGTLISCGGASRIETTLHRGDGSHCLVSVTRSRLTLADREALICVCRDISNQRRIERELASVAARESLQISGRLHEGLAQELAGLSMSLGSLTSRLPSQDAATAAMLQETQRHLTGAVQTAREVAAVLSPTTVVRGSLDSALRALVQEAEARFAAPVQYQACARCDDLEPIIADQLYLIARSALHYAARRRRGSSIFMELGADAESLELRVRWDGEAADSSPAAADVFELDLIGYRTRLIGGTYHHGAWMESGEAIVVTLALG
jgi:signal transduction histidine kinase/tetratricopeptide (TPR) repeat protein